MKITDLDVIHADHPIGGRHQRSILHLGSSIIGVDATQNHLGTFLSRLCGQGKGERIGCHKSLIIHGLIHGDHLVDRDLRESHTQNTIKFGNNKRGTLESGSFAEIDVFGLDTSHSHDIIGYETLDTSASVNNLEACFVLFEGGRLLLIIGRVGPAGSRPAFFAGNPEVGGSSVENYFEFLSRGTDLNCTEVLGIENIRNVFFR